MKICWIALEPFCIPELEKKGLEYKIVEDFVDKKELFKEVSILSEKKIKAITILTDNWVRNNYPSFAEADLALLEYYYYYLMRLFDSVMMRIFIFEKIFSSLNPDKIIICKKESTESESLSIEIPWSEEESVWAYCIKLFNYNNKTSIHIIDYTGEDKELLSNNKNLLQNSKRLKIILWGKTSISLSLNSIRNIFKEIFKKLLGNVQTLKYNLPYFYNLIRILKHESFYGVTHFIKSKKIVLLNSGSNWQITNGLFNKEGFSFYQFKCGINKIQLKSETCDYVSKIGIDEFLVFRGINFSSLIKQKLNRLINHGIYSFYTDYLKTIKLLKRIKAKAILSSVITLPNEWIILHTARLLNIPIFCWGHGASGQSVFTKQKAMELLICDFYFTQGQGSQQTYKKYKDYSFTPVPIGSPSLDRLSKALNTKELINEYDFLYVTTNYYHNNFYLSFFPGVFDNELYETQYKIIKILDKQNMKTLFKVSEKSIHKGFHNRLFGNDHISVEDKIPFEKFLHLAKAIIIDNPTTVLLESLLTRKPIFVLTQFIKLTSMAYKLLRKRAVCCNSIEELVVEINYYIHSGIYKADISNDDYIKAFGTFMNDGKSAERGVDYVTKYISFNLC
ncbi:MAG: hypothetical protein RDU14_06915 [Melioribacteraceae bacterium]|nr:hypothetical protein [Melioribacteraceae bacterium]